LLTYIGNDFKGVIQSQGSRHLLEEQVLDNGIISVGLTLSAQMDRTSLTSLVLLRCAVLCRCLLLNFLTFFST